MTTTNEDEITRQIKHFKNKKAAGKVGIVAETLKAEGRNIIEEITRYVTNGINTREFKNVLIHPLHKKVNLNRCK